MRIMYDDKRILFYGGMIGQYGRVSPLSGHPRKGHVYNDRSYIFSSRRVTR